MRKLHVFRGDEKIAEVVLIDGRLTIEANPEIQRVIEVFALKPIEGEAAAQWGNRAVTGTRVVEPGTFLHFLGVREELIRQGFSVGYEVEDEQAAAIA